MTKFEIVGWTRKTDESKEQLVVTVDGRKRTMTARDLMNIAKAVLPEETDREEGV